MGPVGYTINEKWFASGSSYSFDSDDGFYTMLNATEVDLSDGATTQFTVPSGHYFMLGRFSYPSSAKSRTMFKAKSQTVVTIHGTGSRPTISTNKEVCVYEHDTYQTKGSLVGYSSSSSSGGYPQDGLSGSYWYEYQGSDNIDPRGCVIPLDLAALGKVYQD